MAQSRAPRSDAAVKLARLKRQYQELKRKGDVRGALRLKALIAYHEGNDEETVARCYGVSVKSLRRWIKREERNQSLADAARSGRPPELTPEQQEELKTILREQNQRVWTARHVYVLLLTTFGVAYSVKYLPELLRTLGLSYHKAEHILYRQNRQQRREWLEKTLPALYQKQLAEGWRLFYQDEVGFQTDGTLVYSWGFKGEPILVPNYGVRGRVNLIGALELGTGVFYGVLTRFEVNATRFRRFLCHLKREMRHDNSTFAAP
jgi:transposase